RAELERRYAEKFAPVVQALREQLAGGVLPEKPTFVTFDYTDPRIGHFQIRDVDDPTRSYTVRLPLRGARVQANNAIEERRLQVFLSSGTLNRETRDSMVHIVAYD